MPVILTTPEEVETWMTAPADEALKLLEGRETGRDARLLLADAHAANKDFAAAEKGLTARFTPSYEHTTATSVTPLATKYKATSNASVAAAGVSQAGPNTVDVLVFVDQTVTNTQLQHPRLDRSRIKVTMVKVNGRWLVDNLQPI